MRLVMKDDLAEALGSGKRIHALAPPAEWRLCLLGHWKLTDAHGNAIALPGRAVDLLAFLAIWGQSARTLVAGSLWPESSEAHAQTNLRTTTAVLQKAVPGVVVAVGARLDLVPTITTDLSELRAAIVQASSPLSEIETLKDSARTLLVTADLLPESDSDWAMEAREQLRVEHLQAINMAAESLCEVGELSLALAAAQSAAVLDPMAESAHRLLARIHLERGDRVKAYLTYEDFRKRSINEFGLGPSSQFQKLVEPLTAERTARLEAERLQGRRRRR